MTLLTAARIPARALLIAADTVLARHIEQTLRALGCGLVEIAGDGAEARKRCVRLVPELILIDLQLGPSNAPAVAAQLAAQSTGPVIYLCDPERDLPAAALVHGFGFVDKPVTQHGLSRGIALALHRHGVETVLRAQSRPRADTSSSSSQPSAAPANRMSGELLSSMAHELRAPLQGVVGFASFLREGKAGNVSETQRQYLDHIAMGANHVLQVVNDVLDLTATDSDTLHVRTEAVDPEQVTREVLQVLQVIAIRRRVDVDVRIDEQLGHVVSDATKIKQVLYNFVSNALKFTPAGGHIRVSLRREGPDAFCIEVADTGVGIARETLPFLFEGVTRGARDSQGLGLLITKRIVDALGGTVSAENRPEGGSLFSARLPIAPSVANMRVEHILLPNDP
jgi:signal transduction histidine kinase